MTNEQAMLLATACRRAIEIVEDAVATLFVARDLVHSVHGAWLVGAEMNDVIGYARVAQDQMQMIYDKLAAGELTPSPTRSSRFTENHAECHASKMTPPWHRALANRRGVPGQRPRAGVVGVDSAVAVTAAEVGA